MTVTTTFLYALLDAVGLCLLTYLSSQLRATAQQFAVRKFEPIALFNVPVDRSLAFIPDNSRSYGIAIQDCQLFQIEEKLGMIMVGKKGFLNHGYTIRMLSDETGIQSHVLSAYINRTYGVNFNDFINEYRIRFCIEKIRNGEWKYKTLEALSKESGFNNRNSFTLSFKKVTGLTPSNFLRQLRLNN